MFQKKQGLNRLPNGTLYVNYTWTPTDDQIGQQLIVVSVTDSALLNTLENFYVSIFLPELELNLECCDLRNENCDHIMGQGEFSKGETIYLKIQLIEV